MEDRIFHYCKLNTAIEYILKDQKLLLGPLIDTNDPRENKSFVFAATYGLDSDFKGLNENNFEVSNLLREGCKVICFSCNHKHSFGYEYSKMWAHYGNNHKGLCIELDKQTFLEENSSIVKSDLLKPINYKEFDPTKPYEGHKIVDYSAMKQIGKEKYIKELFRKHHLDYLYFTKDKEWESEREVRLLHFSETFEKEYCSIKNSIRHIYLGVDFNNAYLPSIINLCQDVKISKLEYTGVRLTDSIVYYPKEKS